MLVAAMLSGKNKAGEKLMKEGGEAEARKEYDKALEAYEKAYTADPKDPAYQMAVRRMRFQGATSHVSNGQKIRAAGNLEESLNEFQKAYATDPSLAIAEQEIRRTKDMIDREKKKPAGPGAASTPEDRGLTPSQKAAKEMEAKSASILAIPELKPITRQISTLKMNNQPIKVLYETVGKLAGINVVFDSEIQPPPGGKNTFTVDLSNTTLEEALDYLAIQTRTYWKPLSTNAIFVTNDNVQKRRDFEDYVVKVFYIKNATLLQELQEISTTVRSVTEIRRAFTYGAQNAILVRGTTDQVALAEKLILDLDKPKAEVVVDILVMQASRTRARDLAATFTTSGAGGINSPISFGTAAAATGTATTATTVNSLPLNRLKNISIGDYSVTVPGGLIQALLTDSTTRVLQQPQVRAVDGQKASLRIGDKVPYATGSFGGGLGASVGVGVSPLVSTQFSFAEVGVNVDMVPKIHGRDEVSLHIELEISNVSSYVKIGDISQPVISQKKIAHDIRIREGEVSLLGGLMQVQDSKLIAGLPWLSSLPVLGPLFGTHHQDNSDSELLIALIPHIVRAPDYSDANLRGVSAGTDQNVKLIYAPRPEAAAPPQAAAPATPPPGTPAAPAATAPAPADPAAIPPPVAGPIRIFFNPPNLQTQLSGVVTVALQIENAADLFAVPMKLKFDPKILRLSSVKEGNLMSGDGQKINFTENTLNDTGDATIVLNRTAGTGGISGSGALVNLTFQAVGRGTSTVAVGDLTLVNSTSKPIVAAPPLLTVVVQ